MSILFRRDETGDETRLLVGCPAGRFEFVSRQGPSGPDSTESIRSLEEEEILSRRLLFTRPEAEAACAGLAPKDACVVLAGRNGVRAAPLSTFSGKGAAALRAEAAALVSAGMKRRLLSLSSILTWAAEFGSYTTDFLGLVWPETLPGPSAWRRGVRMRGCDFDAPFGHPCTAVERQREEKRFGAETPRPGTSSALPTGTPPPPPRE